MLMAMTQKWFFGADEEFRRISLPLDFRWHVAERLPFLKDRRDDYNTLPVQVPPGEIGDMNPLPTHASVVVIGGGYHGVFDALPSGQKWEWAMPFCWKETN